MKLFGLSFLFFIFLFFNHATCLTPDQIKNGILNGTITSIEAKDVNIDLGEVLCLTWQGLSKINPATPIVLATISTKLFDVQSISFTENKKTLIKNLLNNDANLLHQYTREKADFGGGAKKAENCWNSRLIYDLDNYHQEVTNWFIRNKKINDKVDQDENTLLHLLAQNNAFLEDIKKLLAQGAQANVINKKGQTPLHIATQCIKDDPYASPQAQLTAQYFIDSTNIDLTEFYTCPLARNPEYNEKQTLLYRLWFAGDFFKQFVANWLVNKKKIDAVFDDKNNTLFHYLANNNMNFDWIKWLIANNASVEATNTDGQTPLHIALGKEHAGPQAQDIALEILHSTNVNLVKQHTFKYKQGFLEREETESLFQTAFKYKPTAHIAINKILQSNQQGADLGGGNKLIHFLARSYFEFLSSHLNDSNAKVKLMPLINDKNNDGDTPLALACTHGRLNNVQTLLGLTPKPQIDIVNKNNETILYLAVYHRSLPILEYLLQNTDAQTLINKTAKNGKTPIQIVIDNVTGSGHNPDQLTIYSKTLKLLLEYGAKKDELIDKIKKVNTYATWKSNFDKVIEVIQNTNPKAATSAGSAGTGSGKPHSSSGAANPLAKKLSKLQKNLHSLRKKLTDLGHNLETLKAKLTTKATPKSKWEW